MNLSRFRAQTALALLGLAVVLGVLAFGASSPSQRTDSTYVEAMVGAPRFVNPLLATSDTDTDLAHLVFSGLTRLDDTGAIAPDLAAAWQISPDARVYTFTLRPDLKWQDGAALTSADVYFTVNLLRDKDFPGDSALAARWRDVQPGNTDDDTVVFSLPKPDASFLQYTTLGILPQHVWSGVKAADLISSGLNALPVGAGPWQYVNAKNNANPTPGNGIDSSTTLTQGQTLPGVLLEPNPSYDALPASISYLWFRPYPTFGAALTGFRAGEVHGLGHIPTELLGEVSQVPGVKLHEQSRAGYTMLLVNTKAPVLQDAQTRQAIESAIERDALARLAHASALNSPILPHSWAYDPAVARKGYDPAEARRLLDSAGWVVGTDGVRTRNGTRLSVVMAAGKDDPVNVQVANMIAQDLRSVSIDVQLALVAHDSLVNDYLGRRAYHLALVNWQAAGADPDLFAYWHSSQNTTGFDYSGWANPQADSSLQGALDVPDQAARTRLYSQFQQAFAQDVPAVVLYAPLYTYATRDPAAGVNLPRTDILSPAQRFDTVQDWFLQPGK